MHPDKHPKHGSSDGLVAGEESEVNGFLRGTQGQVRTQANVILGGRVMDSMQWEEAVFEEINLSLRSAC
eukprot:3964754-Amphidinium_carterae.1